MSTQQTDYRSVTGLFQLAASANPDREAIWSDDQSLSYGELESATNRAANYILNELGILPGSVIALCADRTPAMVISILGILKAGSAYLPLDPQYPKDRIDFMLADSMSTALLRVDSSQDGMQLEHPRTIFHFDEAMMKASDAAPVLQFNEAAIAYIIYTSGSTGRPKGVKIPHRALSHYAEKLPGTLGLRNSDRYVHTASISFSSSIRQLMIPLSIGASVHIASSETIQNPAELFNSIASRSSTVVDLVPSYWKACVTALRLKGTHEFESLRLGLSASEPLRWETAIAVKELFPNMQFINMFGQTETAGIVCTNSVSKADADTGFVPVGRPFGENKVHILDHVNGPLAVGETGEIYVSGPSLAEGYIGLAGLNSERFVTMTLFGTPQLMYRTGDLGRFMDDGRLHHLGRLDSQVKIRGFRVDLGEVENALLADDRISGTCVTAKDEDDGNKRLTAYFTSETEISHSDLRRHLSRRLPSYMMPSAFVRIQEFPIGPNGKIDRAELLKIKMEQSIQTSGNYIDAQDETQRVIAQIFRKVLNLDRPINAKDDFFALGGDSLLAVNLMVEIEERCGRSLPISVLADSPTIAGISAHVREGICDNEYKYLVPLKAGDRLPFYTIHAAGGSVLFYRDLANSLPANQPVVGVRARGILDKTKTAHDCIEEMAADYLREIKIFQPSGPYLFGGSSFGGLVAFELARQLQSIGDEVALIALFDTYAPGYRTGRTSNIGRVESIVWRCSTLLKQMYAAGSITEAGSIAIEKIRKGRIRTKRKINWKMNQFDIAYKRATGKELPPDMQRNHKAIEQAKAKYRPRPFDGDIVLFRASHQLNNAKQDLGWTELVNGRLTILEVPGSHGSLTVNPYAEGLAAALEPFLVHAESGHRMRASAG